MNELDLFDDDEHYLAVSGLDKVRQNLMDIQLPYPTSGTEQYPETTGSAG